MESCAAHQPRGLLTAAFQPPRSLRPLKDAFTQEATPQLSLPTRRLGPGAAARPSAGPRRGQATLTSARGRSRCGPCPTWWRRRPNGPGPAVTSAAAARAHANDTAGVARPLDAREGLCKLSARRRPRYGVARRPQGRRVRPALRCRGGVALRG